MRPLFFQRRLRKLAAMTVGPSKTSTRCVVSALVWAGGGGLLISQEARITARCSNNPPPPFHPYPAAPRAATAAATALAVAAGSPSSFLPIGRLLLVFVGGIDDYPVPLPYSSSLPHASSSVLCGDGWQAEIPEPLTMRQGDLLSTTCIYNSTARPPRRLLRCRPPPLRLLCRHLVAILRDSPLSSRRRRRMPLQFQGKTVNTSGGFSTYEEMCIAFISYCAHNSAAQTAATAAVLRC